MKRAPTPFSASSSSSRRSCISRHLLRLLPRSDRDAHGASAEDFYFHVPAAYSMYVGATACFIARWAMIRPNDLWTLGRQGGDRGHVRSDGARSGPALAARRRGAFIGRGPAPHDGALSVLVYARTVRLGAARGDGEGERNLRRRLDILGAANCPCIHFSVRKWRPAPA